MEDRIQIDNSFLISEWFHSWSECGLDTGLFSLLPSQAVSRLQQLGTGESYLAPEVLFLIGAPIYSETKTLLARMVAAMGLTPGQVAISMTQSMNTAWLLSDMEPRSFSHCRIAVLLGEASAQKLDPQWVRGQWREGFLGNAPALATHGLEEMLNSPQLKKAAWEDLQQVIRRLA